MHCSEIDMVEYIFLFLQYLQGNYTFKSFSLKLMHFELCYSSHKQATRSRVLGLWHLVGYLEYILSIVLLVVRQSYELYIVEPS